MQVECGNVFICFYTYSFLFPHQFHRTVGPWGRPMSPELSRMPGGVQDTSPLSMGPDVDTSGGSPVKSADILEEVPPLPFCATWNVSHGCHFVTCCLPCHAASTRRTSVCYWAHRNRQTVRWRLVSSVPGGHVERATTYVIHLWSRVYSFI
jgi:hypothetical protein